MLLSDALKKPRKKASKQTSAPTPTPVAPPPAPVVTAPAAPATAEVTSFLRTMKTKTGDETQEVRLETLEDALRYVTRPSLASEIRASWKDLWFVTPWNRQRLDHYVGAGYHPGPDDDPEGWDEQGWWEEYARPLKREVQAKLNDRFGKGLFSVSIGEKGHIEVTRA